MTCVICLENRGGVMFNHRRVSRDAVVTDRILKLATEHGPLNITPYTLRLLPQENIPSRVVHICDHPAAEGEGTCWLEDTVGELRPDAADRLILFRWNRTYPADTLFDQKAFFSGGNWELESQEEFPGKSHKKITMEVYHRA